MKRIIRFLAVVLVLMAMSSCNKTKYCQCFAFIDNEDIPLGEDYYIVEDGTCNDKAKEIFGWGAVTCKEVSVESENDSWYSSILNFFKPNNNNNNNSNNNH